MVNFLTQPDIEAVLLTTALGLIGLIFKQWRKSRRGSKIFGMGKKFSPRHQLPSVPANFVGRKEEVAEIQRKILSAHKVGDTLSGKHVALHGMGGVGKTAMATVLAHRLKDQFKDAQLYLNLRGADPEKRLPLKPAEAMQIIIRSLRNEAILPEEVNQLTPIYNSILNEAGSVLLFLDNAADGEQIKPLLPPVNCLLLITSRTQFSLPEVFSQNVDCLRPENSQELLLKLATRINGSEKEVAELCGHLPLALEIFAGVVNNKKLFTVSELIKRQHEKQQEFTPVDAAFQVSYELLPSEIRRRWTLLSLFPASFDLAAATAVWEEKRDSARDAMQTLVSASLVEWNEANGRFRLHDLASQFCDHKLTEAERTTAKLNYARYYRDIAITAENTYEKGGEDLLRGLALFEQEQANIENMFEWLHSKQDQESALLLVTLLDIMNHTCKLRVHPRQRIKWLESQLFASLLLKDRKSECKSFGHLGVAHFELGDTHKSMEFFNKALAIGREIGYRRGECGALVYLGVAYSLSGENDIAIDYYEKSLTISRETEDRRGEGSILNYLAGIYKDMGDYHRAIATYGQALAIGRQIGDKRNEVAVLANLGIVYCNLDDVRKGIKYLEESLNINRRIGDRHQEAGILCSLGNSLKQFGDYDNAVKYYEQGLQSAQESGNLRVKGLILSCYAGALHDLGNFLEAIAMAEKSLKISEVTQDSNAFFVRENLSKWRGQLKLDRLSEENEIQTPPS